MSDPATSPKGAQSARIDELSAENEALRRRLAETESALRQSELRFRQMAETLPEKLRMQRERMPIGCIVFDERNCFIQVNPAAERIFGYTEEELRGRHAKAIVPEPLWPHVDGILNRLAEGDMTAHSVNENVTKDGRTILCDWTNTPLRNAEGVFVGILSMAQDVTARQQAEEALRASEERYRTLVGVLPAAVYTCDAEGKITFFNDRAAQMWGRRPKLGDSGERFCGAYRLWLPDGRPLPHDQTPMARAIREGVSFRSLEVAFEQQEGDRLHALINIDPLRDAKGHIVGAVNAFVDITERKRAEVAVREHAEELESLLDAVPAAVWITHDPQCQVITGNRRANEFYEAESGENVSASTRPEPRRFFTPGGRELSPRELPMQVAAATNQAVRDVELEVRVPSGRHFTMFGGAVPLRNEDGGVRGCIATFLDITARKQAEEALRQSREDLNRAQEVGQTGSWRLDVRHDILTWSDENYRIFGLPKGSTLTYESFLQCVHPDDRPYVEAQWKAGLRGEPYDIEHRIVVNGQVKWVRQKAYLESDESGALLVGFGITQDITQRKAAEEALRNSEARFRLALRNAPVSVAAQDRELRYIWTFNERSATPDQIIGHFDHEIFTPAEAEQITALKQRVLEEGVELRKQMWFDRPTGRMFLDITWEPIRNGEGAVVGVASATVDLTPLKLAQQAAQQSRARLEAALGSMTDAVFITDAAGNFVDFNEAFATFFRFPSQWECGRDFAGYPGILDLFLADGALAPLDLWPVPRALRGDTVPNAEYTLRRKDTGESWAGSFSFGPIRDEQGEIAGAVVVARDVTAQKKVQDEIRRLAQFPEQNPSPVLRVGRDGTLLYANAPAEDWLAAMGWQTGNPLPDTLRAAASDVAALDGPAEYEIEDLRGNTMWFSALQPSGERYVNLYGRDITESKKSNAALRWSVWRHEVLSETAARLLESENPQGLVEELCRQVMDLTDCQAFFNFLVEDQGQKRLRLNACAGIAEQDARNIEWLDVGVAVCGCVARDGQRIIAEEIGSTPDQRTELIKSYGVQAYCCHPLRVQDRLIGTLSFGTRSRSKFKPEEIEVMRSVSDLVAMAMHRIRIEEALRRSEERFRLLVEQTPDGIFVADAQGHYIDVNAAGCQLAGYSREEILGRSIADLVAPEDRPRIGPEIARFASEPVTCSVWTFLRKDGATFVGEVVARQLPDGRLQAILRDITERKKAEEAIKASLLEKEVLLKEIHHRVKNNMQVISSLASLQAGELQDATVHAALQDMSHRVRSMAMVHERLYESPDLARIDFAAYARSLLDYLWRAYSRPESDIRLHFDLDPLQLPVDVAIPCGLALNELAANTLKHAFPGRPRGNVTVSLHTSRDGTARLGVRDDGVGLPENLDWQNAKSLGLRLVQMLARQLHAVLKVTIDGGTEVAMSFGVNKEKGR